MKTQSISILLGIAGLAMVAYALPLLPLPVALLIAGLLCIAGAVWWYGAGNRSQPDTDAEASATTPELPEEPITFTVFDLKPPDTDPADESVSPPTELAQGPPPPPEPLSHSEPAFPPPSRPEPARRPLRPVQALAMTYQDGQMTRRHKVSLRLGGRRRG